MKEIELKAYYLPEEKDKIKTLEKEISEYAKKDWREEKIVDLFFDTKELSLKKKGIDLRCRKTEKETVLTYKGPIERETGYKVREEIETRVDDQEKISKIFERIGLNVRRKIEKKRKIIEIGEVIVTIDYFKRIGYVVELEGKPSNIEILKRNWQDLEERLGAYSFKDILETYKKYRTKRIKNE